MIHRLCNLLAVTAWTWIAFCLVHGLLSSNPESSLFMAAIFGAPLFAARYLLSGSLPISIDRANVPPTGGMNG